MSEPIRVLRIIDRLNIGGPAKHVVWLSQGLNSGGFETTLVIGTVPQGEGDMGYFAERAGLQPIVIREMSRELGPGDAFVIAKLVRLMFRLRPHVVHTHKSKAGAAGRAAAAIYRWLTPSALILRPRPCRVVHTFHGHIFHSYYGPLKTRAFVVIERALARFTDHIVTISEQQRAEICDEFRVGRAEQFRVIPLGIDLSEFDNGATSFREEIASGEDDILVGIVGRLCEVKDHATFLRAAAAFLEGASTSGPKVRFVIIGDGHLRGELESLARELGIADRVVFTGFREDAARLYGELDIVALTSLNEGTPLTLIEGMACGRPVIATEVGGVVDILGERRSSGDGVSIWDHGVTVARSDASAFARGLAALTEDKSLRQAMGARACGFVRDRLSKERLVRDVEELYIGLVRGESGG